MALQQLPVSLLLLQLLGLPVELLWTIVMEVRQRPSSQSEEQLQPYLDVSRILPDVLLEAPGGLLQLFTVSLKLHDGRHKVLELLLPLPDTQMSGRSNMRCWWTWWTRGT